MALEPLLVGCPLDGGEVGHLLRSEDLHILELVKLRHGGHTLALQLGEEGARLLGHPLLNLPCLPHPGRPDPGVLRQFGQPLATLVGQRGQGSIGGSSAKPDPA
ncbi:hypothetical protein D3C86_1199940 [compost metagenome]